MAGRPGNDGGKRKTSLTRGGGIMLTTELLVRQEFLPTTDFVASIIQVICPTCSTKDCRSCVYFHEIVKHREEVMSKMGLRYLM